VFYTTETYFDQKIQDQNYFEKCAIELLKIIYKHDRPFTGQHVLVINHIALKMLKEKQEIFSKLHIDDSVNKE